MAQVLGAPANSLRPTSLLAVRATAILWFIGATGFLISLPIVLSASSLVALGVVVIAAILAVPIAWLVRKIRHSRRRFVATWLKVLIALAFVLSTLIAAPVIYFAASTEMRPAAVPQATLTDGKRTVVFQGMQHVGTESFYKAVVYDLEQALADGYVLYYEGVGSSTKEADAWFRHLVTGDSDLTDTYRALGEVCGLKFQNDYLKLIAGDARIHPQSHVTADVTTLQLLQEYNRLMATDPSFAEARRAQPTPSDGSSDASKSIVSFLRAGTEGQRELAGVICRGFMTGSMRRAQDPTSDEPLDKIILDFRNRELASRLLTDPRDKIYIKYGAKHLPGLLALLKRGDPNWRLVSLKWMRTIDAPEHVTGSVPSLR